MTVTNTDAVLWYNVGQFGELGYSVPNWSDDVGTLNPQIYDFTQLVGQNLFAIMHHEDVDLRTPPSINTLRRIHKLYIRAGKVLEARAIAPGKLNMEGQHVSPGGEVFLVFPVPYFRVRNAYLKRWCGLVLMMLAESFQHTENRKEVEISTSFAGQMDQYLRRVYVNMAVELFGLPITEAEQPGFLLSDEQLSAYDPTKWFTGTELVDTVPHLGHVLTEDQLSVLREGIPITSLPALSPWPVNLTTFYSTGRTSATSEGAPAEGERVNFPAPAP